MRGVSRWSKHATLVEESSPHAAARRMNGARAMKVSGGATILGLIILLLLVVAPSGPPALYVIGSVLFLAGMLGLTLPAPGRKKEE
jgi:hypothetical protein